MAPVIKALEAKQANFYILHTGQHYSYILDMVFFEQLRLPLANYNLEAGPGSHGEQTARILTGVERVLQKDRPDIVLVLGDTNSVLAGALAAAKLSIKVGHVEAGLRSYDRQMPEEINRILTDHCSDYLFAPSPQTRDILLHEGILEKNIYITGNTIVDSVYQHKQLAEKTGTMLKPLHLTSQKYFLVTLHRQENVDNPDRLASILDGLNQIFDQFRLPVVYPIHPRSRKMIQEFAFEPRNITLIDPVDYLDFLQLENNAKLILTDSGGVQEEACILRVPCVTLRDNTERPETIEVGANILAGVRPQRILECVTIMCHKDTSWNNPFGDGTAGEKIVQIITSQAN